jgi:hypothetical protein
MSSDPSLLSSLEILQLYSNGGRYLEESNLYLSEDGKEIFFLGGGSSSLPVATRNATEEDVLESYTLASIYLLCIYPNDLRNYRKSCERANCIPVKTTDKPKILTMLLGEDYYNQIMSQQQQQQDSTAISKDKDKQKHAEEEKKIKDHRGKQHEHSSKKHHHHRENHSSSKHHHHHKHKSSVTNKEISSSNKRSKASLLSKDQVLENLTLVVDKRSDKKYQTPTAEEDTPMKGTSEDPQLSQQLQTPEDPNQLSENISPAVVVSSEEEELQKKQQLRELLSDKSLVVTDDEVLANDLQKTNIIIGMEIPVGDSFSILRAPGRDLSRVLEMYAEATRQQQRQSSSSRGGASKSSSPSKNDAKDSKSKKNMATGSMKPVIIVPNTMTSPITLLNSIEFFSQGKFVSRETIVKQRTASSTVEIPKTQPYTFTRKIAPKYLTSSGGGITAGTPTGGNPSSSHNLLEYEIIDNPIKYLKSRQDWDRIVAVVALGASWQFKGWHGKFQVPVELFNKVKGYYFGMQENINVPKEVQGWNIQTILLARDNRSSDGVAHAKFWNTLDEWMAIHKPELLPSSMEA